MNLCSDGHDEVCFETRKCPCCEIIKEKDSEIDLLKDDLENANSGIETLKQSLES